MNSAATSVSLKIFLAVSFAGMPGFCSTAFAFPEFVRHGYFSCTSCHVSPGGGGILTDYGRSYSAEKLSARSSKGEEEPLHGALGGEPGQGVRRWLLVGGNIRQVQTVSENRSARDGRWIPMQRDLELCVTGGPVIGCVTGGITKHGMREPDGKSHYGVRKASVQIQAGESWLVRAGRFSPRFGVMVPDHNAWIQSLSGRGIDDERDQLEMTFSSEKFEASAALDHGRSDKPEVAKGFVANLMTPLLDTMRVGASYRLQESEASAIKTAGFFAAAGIDEKTFVLAEIDQQSIETKVNLSAPSGGASRVASYFKTGRELSQGVIAYAVQQIDLKEGGPTTARRDMYGMGLQLFPRPHFEVDGFVGKVLSRSDFAYVNTAWLLFHYYL